MLVCVCVYYSCRHLCLHISGYMDGCTCMCSHTRIQRPVVDVMNHPWSFFYIIHWVSVSQPNSEVTDMTSFPNQLALGILCLCLLRLELQVATILIWHHVGFKDPNFSPHTCMKCFNHWAILLVPKCRFSITALQSCTGKPEEGCVATRILMGKC